MKPLRQIARRAFVYGLYITGLLLWARRRVVRQNATAVLTFHRVLSDDELKRTSSLPGIIVCEATFAKAVAYLARHCQVVDLTDNKHPERRERGRPKVAITFDDGWADNIVASVILQRYGLSASLFVCPGLMGKTFPFWPERFATVHRQSNENGATQLEASIETLKQVPPARRDAVIAALPLPSESDLRRREPLNATLDWADMTEVRKRGVAIGSHTFSHQILTQLSPEEMSAELSRSRAAIETQLGEPCLMLAYPNGNCDSAVRDATARAGYHLAFTTRPGLWRDETDPLQIPRVNLSENHLTGIFGGFSRAMLEYHVFWRAGRSRPSYPSV